MRRGMVFLLAVSLGVFFAGCGETFHGMGKDIKRMGKGVKTIFVSE